MKSIRCYIFSFFVLAAVFFGIPASSGCSFLRTASVDVETTAGDTASNASGSSSNKDAANSETDTPEATTEAETTTTQPYYLVSGEGDGNTRYVKLQGTGSESSDNTVYPEYAPAIFALGDNILLYWFDYNYNEGFSEEAVHFILYSPRSGQAVATADYELSYLQAYPKVTDNVLFFIEDGTMYIFDETLTLTAQISDLSPSYNYELVAGGTVLYYTDWTEEQSYRADLSVFLSDRSVTLLTSSNLTFTRAFPDYKASSIFDTCGGSGYFAAEVVDEDYLDYIVIADAATEEIVLMLPYRYYSYLNMDSCSCTAMWYDSAGASPCLSVYDPGAYSDSLTIADVLDGAQLTVSYDGAGDNFYPVTGTSMFFETCEDLDTFEHYYVCYESDGSYLSSFRCTDTALEDGYYGISTYDYIWLEDISCVVFPYSEDEGEWGLFFWLLNEASDAPSDFPEELGNIAEGKSPAEDSTETPEDEQGSLAPLYERAKVLSEETGLTILVGKDVSFLADGGYDVAPEEDYDDLAAGLDMLEYILSRYPDGFFDQLRFGNMYSIRVALAGSITSDGSVYLTSAGGYVTNGDNCIELVIDVNDSGMENAFYHEFSHIIDRYLEYISMYETDSPYSETTWLTYTPDGFSYCEDYTDYYTFYWDNYTSEYDEYFLDAYSVINATEDRAQLMEDALGRKWSANGYGIAQITGLQEKYRYYCDCIRWGFDTTGWPDITEWEAVLYEIG